MTDNPEETAMRRYSVLLLCVFALSFGVRAWLPSVRAAENAPTEAKDESKKDSEAAKKEDAAKEEKSAAKETEKSAKSESEKKDAEKPADAAAKEKDKAAKTEEKPAAKDEKKPAAKPEAKKRKTHKVETKRMKIDVPLDGVFVASKMTEVPLRPEAWAEFEIEDVVEHGAKVHKGEQLIKFDDKKINEAIQDLELDQRLSELMISRSEEEMPRMEKTLKMDFADAERTDKNAKEDFKRYNETDRPMAVKSAEFMLRYYNFMLDYEKDELNELEKMYKADDLTEETEEIVLKRQKNAVEFAQFSVENAKIDSEEMIKVRIPRMDIRLKEALDRAALAKARAQMALNTDLNRARYELEQRKKLRTKSLDRHTKLLGDKELMEIESPADGIVFYGQCVNGRWSDTPSLINRYKPKNNVTSSPAIMTIVETRPLYVTSTVDEAKRPEVSDGQKIKVTLPAEGSDRVNGDVKSISPIPVSTGKYEINFNVEQDQIPKWVVPGTSCKVAINVYDNKDALVVPKKAVHTDKDDPDKQYVWLVTDPDDEDAKPERRNVKLGKRKDEDVEILKGLKKGDVISLDDEEAKEKEAKEKAEKEKEKSE
jgi:HlyD family secretion protein